MALDRDLLLDELTLIGPAATARLTEAISEPPTIARTIDGASTLDVTLVDYDRALLRSGIFDERSWANVDDLGYDLVAIGKSGDRLTLTFEDSVVAALRRRNAPRSWVASSSTRARVLSDLAGELPVTAIVDPTDRGVINTAIERSASGQVTDSWALAGTVASDAGWRRFSDGRSLIAGSDAWLASRFDVVTLREHTGPVHDIDVRFDAGREDMSASVDIDAARGALPIGSAVELPDLGPASGRWLVAKYSRALTRQRASVELVRATPVLPEAPPEERAAPEADAGESDYLPGSEQPTRTAAAPAAVSTSGSNSARERFIAEAMRHVGKPYIWGGTGPRGYDCSGLTQAAARVAGKPISRVVSTQWADSARRGRRISVAEGLRTRGALLVRLGNPSDHIVISLGNGSTFEARGKAYKIGTFANAARRRWTGAFIWV